MPRRWPSPKRTASCSTTVRTCATAPSGSISTIGRRSCRTTTSAVRWRSNRSCAPRLPSPAPPASPRRRSTPSRPSRFRWPRRRACTRPEFFITVGVQFACVRRSVRFKSSREETMKAQSGRVALLAAMAAFLVAGPALAQKRGGVLKIEHMDNPPSASIHEEATVSVVVPFMTIYNNLVIFDQKVARNSFESIVPDLATSWKWSDDGKQLSFVLRQGVKWHDGKPFTSADVVCTFDLLLEKGKEKLRRNPHASWWTNVESVTADGDFAVKFQLKERQPSLLAILASGYSPMYACHVPVAEMRRKPIGTGPFKFVEFKMNEGIKLTKNENYWKK